MKIVIIGKSEAAQVAGMGVFTRRLKQHLLGQGHTVRELRFTNSPTDGPGVIPLGYHLAEPRTCVLLPHLKSMSLIGEQLQTLAPDVVYLNLVTSPLDFFLPSLCHRLNIPVAGVWHGDFHSSSRAVELVSRMIFSGYMGVCRQLDMLQVFSSRLRQYFLDKGLPPQSVRVIPNGVDCDLYKPGPSSFAREHNIKRGVLFLGRMTAVKNPDLMIQSFQQACARADATLVMVGGGDQLEKLQRKYQHLSNVVFCGAISDESTKIDIINSCQVFVLPSKYEGMSLALLEAMACGLAPIVTDVGTNREVVNGAGIVIPYGQLGCQLPVELEALLADPARAQFLGAHARLRASQEYAQDRVLGEIESNLERLTNARESVSAS